MAKRAYISDEKIRRALRDCQGIRSAAAHRLGISPRTLARWMARQPDLAWSAADFQTWMELQVAGALLREAENGNEKAAMFLLRRWYGWRSGPKPKPSPQKLDFSSIELEVITPKEPGWNGSSAATDERGAAPAEKRKSRS